MSLDPFVHPDSEIQALLTVSGVSTWKLWPPNTPPTDVYLTLRSDVHYVSDKISHDAPIEAWRIAVATMLDHRSEREKA